MKADKKRRAIGLAAGLVLAFAAIDGSARPGGGQSFSGRSSSSSSSSSSGSYRSGSTTSSSSGSSRSTWSGSTSGSIGGSTSGVDGPSAYSGGSGRSGGADMGPPDPSVLKVFGVVFGIIIAFVVGSILISRRRQADHRAWEARAREEALAERKRKQRHANIEAALAAIKSTDDAFSYVLFEDFLYALYGEVHSARGKSDGLARLVPYLTEDALAAYADLPEHEVDAVVIGGMRVASIEANASDDTITVTVAFTSNVSEKDSGAEHAFYMEELWTLKRKANVKSRPPEKARVIGCPNCGAPLDKMVAGKCGYCDVAPARGEQDWFVASIEIGRREKRGPMLTGTTQEVGTDLPTVVARDVKAKLKALEQRDPAFTWRGFIARVERTFHTFHASWSAQDLKDVRPYLSDNLFELQRYWVNAYASQKLKNMTKDASIVTVHLAKVMRDRFFDSITVRVFARCIDFTVDETGKVVGGSQNDVREYSEYWTFIRGVGKTGAPRSDGNCPSCGAPLSNVNMAGTCTSCNAKVTSGEFDWVLSRIEQDEVYEAAA